MAEKYYAHSLPGRPVDSHGKTRENLCSSHREREGEAPAALLLEGATQAPVTAWQLLEDHLKNVAEMARDFAEAFRAGIWQGCGTNSKRFHGILRKSNEGGEQVAYGILCTFGKYQRGKTSLIETFARNCMFG